MNSGFSLKLVNYFNDKHNYSLSVPETVTFLSNIVVTWSGLNRHIYGIHKYLFFAYPKFPVMNLRSNLGVSVFSLRYL